MMLYITRCRRAGFTLIEIMIVIAIIAILAGIMVPNFMEAKAEAQWQTCAENCRKIMLAFNMARAKKSDSELCVQFKSRGAQYNVKLFDMCGAVQSYLIEYGYLGEYLHCPMDMPGSKGNYYVTNDYTKLQPLWTYAGKPLAQEDMTGWIVLCGYGCHEFKPLDIVCGPAYTETFGACVTK